MLLDLLHRILYLQVHTVLKSLRLEIENIKNIQNSRRECLQNNCIHQTQKKKRDHSIDLFSFLRV